MFRVSVSVISLEKVTPVEAGGSNVNNGGLLSSGWLHENNTMLMKKKALIAILPDL
jgi:hypothetical protein